MKNKYSITKADIVLAIVLLVLGLCSPFLIWKNTSADSRLVIEYDGQKILSQELSKDCYIEVTEGVVTIRENKDDVSKSYENLIVVESGKVTMKDANCSGHDCVRMGTITKEGEVIACLPHLLLVTIEAENGGYNPDPVIK